MFTAVVFFVMGCIFSFLGSNATVGGNSYQAGWDAAKKRLSDSGLFGIGMNTEIKSITGEIKEISGDKIIIKIRPLEPLADASLDTRTIVVDSATKMYTLQPKDQTVFLAEMEAYAQKMKINGTQTPMTTPTSTSTPTPVAPATVILPPDGFIRTTISVSDLKVGQMINILSENNIKEVSEFKASEISYYQTINLAAPIIPIIPGASPTVTTTPLK